MAVIRNLVVKISADISSLQQGLTDASKQLQKVSRELTSIGTSLTASVTAPIVALGTAVVKTSSDFQQAMANAASVAGATGSELERMTVLARQMGAETVFSASDAADALYYMASAGYKVGQMEDSIQPILNLASATQNDLADTTDTVIAALNMYSLKASDAERVTNVYASAIGNSMATMGKLAESMTYVGPVANSLNYSIEEVTGALGTLYNAGYEGSTAGTVLRQALVNLMNPSKAALEIFDELGLCYEDLNPETNDFATIVDRLGEAGLTTAQAMEIFGARGGPGMLALLNVGGDAIRDLTSKITNTNAATEMAAMQLDTLTGQWKILKSQLQEVALQFGDVLIPIIRDLLKDYINPLLEKLMSLSDEERLQIVKIAAIAAAIGPLFLVAGKLVGVVSKILKYLPLLTSKTTLIIAAIAAVSAGLVTLYQNSESFRDKVNGIVDAIKAKFEQIIPAIKKLVTDVIEGIEEFWNQHGEAICTAVIEAIGFVWNIVSQVFDSALKLAQAVWPVIKEVVTAAFGAIASFISEYGPIILTVIQTVFEKVKEIFDKVVLVVGSALEKLSEYIAPITEKLQGLLGKILTEFSELLSSLSPIFSAILALLEGALNVVLVVVDGIVSALGPFIQFVEDCLGIVIDLIGAVCALLRGDWDDAWNHMVSIGDGAVSALKNLLNTLFNFFKGIVDGILKLVGVTGADVDALIKKFISQAKEAFENLKESIKNVLQTISTAFTNVWNSIYNFCASIWERIASFFQNIWDKITGIFSNGKTRVVNEWENMNSSIQNIITVLSNFLSQMATRISSNFQNACSSITNAFRSCFNSVQTYAGNIWSSVCSMISNIGSSFSSVISQAYRWGANLVSNIISGIYSMISRLRAAIRELANTISDYVGFSSPSKKGPGSHADEWMPNFVDMLSEGLVSELPRIRESAAAIAANLNPVSTGRAVVGTGSSPFADLLNGYLSAADTAVSGGDTPGDIVLQIDGQTFARLIAPSLQREYRRNGVTLTEV